MQKDGELPSRIFSQGIISPAEAPVVHQGPLAEGVDLHHVIDAAALVGFGLMSIYSVDPRR